MKPTFAGAGIHMNESGPFPPTIGGQRYWVMFND
jgi:hypothetical protein